MYTRHGGGHGKGRLGRVKYKGVWNNKGNQTKCNNPQGGGGVGGGQGVCNATKSKAQIT